MRDAGDASFPDLVRLADPLVISDMCHELETHYAHRLVLLEEMLAELQAGVDEEMRNLFSQATEEWSQRVETYVLKAEKLMPSTCSDLVSRQSIAQVRATLEATARSEVQKLLVAQRLQFDADFVSTRALAIFDIGR